VDSKDTCKDSARLVLFVAGEDTGKRIASTPNRHLLLGLHIKKMLAELAILQTI
jgi:hypothetical protein